MLWFFNDAMKLGCGESKLVKFVGWGPSPKTPSIKSLVAIPAIILVCKAATGKSNRTGNSLTAKRNTSALGNLEPNGVISIFSVACIVQVAI